MVPTSDTVKYKYLLNNLISNKKNTIIMGDSGSGKTTIIKHFLNTFKNEDYKIF